MHYMSLPAVKEMYAQYKGDLLLCPLCREKILFAQVAGKLREASVSCPVEDSCSETTEHCVDLDPAEVS